MKCLSLIVVLVVCLITSLVQAANVPNIRTEADLDAALAQAQAGDVLTLAGDVVVSGVKKIPSQVILQGNRHTLSLAPEKSGEIIRVEGATGVVVRGARIVVPKKRDWNISVANGDARFIDCFIDARVIAWAFGTISIEDSTSIIRFPERHDFITPYVSYGNRAVLLAKNSLFVVGWEVGKQAGTIFSNNGGNIASRLEIANCTIVATTDMEPDQGGLWVMGQYKNNRHIAFVGSHSDSEGSDYYTSMVNSIVIGEASSVFHNTGAGVVISRNNNNAGMLRNPQAFGTMNVDAPGFYKFVPWDRPVNDDTGDFREYNPFVNALAGDYRLMAHSRSATAGADGGPIGARLGVVEAEHNAINLSFTRSDPAVSNIPLDHQEIVFDGWRLHRETNDQYFLSGGDAQDATGSARLEAYDTVAETRGSLHNQYVNQSIRQTFCVIPGHVYTIKAWARRSSSDDKHPWTNNGMYATAVLGVANGHQTDPNKMDETVVIKGAEGAWTQGEIKQFRADSNQLTIHLMNRTNGSFNRVDWDNVTIEGAPDPNLR